MQVKHLIIPDSEITFSAVRSQGAGGQNVNKVSSAIHLKYDITASSLPEDVKHRLLALNDQRVSKEGVFIVKSQETRSQLKNKALALERLEQFIVQALLVKKTRKKTGPSKAAKLKRLKSKVERGELKKSRKIPVE